MYQPQQYIRSNGSQVHIPSSVIARAGSVDDVLRTSRYVKRGEKEEEEMGIRFK